MSGSRSIDRWYESADGLRLYYRDYPAATPGRLPLLCLPGLTRNSRDFAHVAERLEGQRRVLCPDLRGRGRSQHDPNWNNYHPGTYLGDIERLLEAAGVDRCVFFGTSLGGILTMLTAAVNPGRIAAAILNDIGPEVDPVGIARIAAYVGRHPAARSWDEAVANVRSTYGHTLPGLSDEQWLAHARRTYADVDGLPRLDHDPNIGEAVRSAPAGAAPDLWPMFAALRELPTLALRGETSDILSVRTFEKMQAVKPDLVRVVVRHRGHVPLLDEPEAVTAIDDFLASVP
ncbi:MAG: alpha/beta fold hydrolase [Steroidobacteraceae bacterium]